MLDRSSALRNAPETDRSRSNPPMQLARMEFSPNNPIVLLCLQGMALQDAGKPEEARQRFLQAWTDTTRQPVARNEGTIIH